MALMCCAYVVLCRKSLRWKGQAGDEATMDTTPNETMVNLPIKLYCRRHNTIFSIAKILTLTLDNILYFVAPGM